MIRPRMICLARLSWQIAAVTVCLFATRTIAATNDDGGFEEWKCDKLTPNLCDLSVETDLIPMRGGLSVRYWRYTKPLDTVASSSSVKGKEEEPPLIVAHGGPSWPHQYLLPLKQIACGNRDVIFYDQAGCGESPFPEKMPPGNISAIQETYPWLLDPDYYALEELPNLVESLGIEKFHLLGHSWGTMLAQIFALNSTSPTRDNLQSMILSGPISDAQYYIQEQWDPNHGTLGRLPPYVQGRIQSLEADKAYDSEEYQLLDDILTLKFTTRTAPLPDCFAQSAQGVNFDIYVAMQGASEFVIGGVLAHFNTTKELQELVNLPVLLTSGSYDTVRPTVANVMHQNLPLSEHVIFSKSGHVTAMDEPERMNNVVSSFLERVEEATKDGLPFMPVKDVTSNPDVLMSESPAFATSGSHNWTMVVLISLMVGLAGFAAGRYTAPNGAGYQVVGEATV